MNKKGFTLVEILAVIIIIGILVGVSIPSVTEYIFEARKDAYVSSIKGYVDAVRNKVANMEYSFTRKDTVYYVHIDNIELEKGGKNPYGEWVEAYVVVTYDGMEHKYYWTSIDSVGNQIDLKLASDITVNDITTEGEGWINNTASVEQKEKIHILSSNGEETKTEYSVQLTQKDAKDCYQYTVSNGAVTITEYNANCPKDVEIPSKIGGYPVTTIGSYAFSNFGLTTVKIPEGIVTINSSAFRSNQITDVNFPTTLKTLGSEAFANNKLTSIALTGSVSIGAGAFTNNAIPEESAMIYKMNSDGTVDYSTLIGYAGTSKDIVIPETVNGVTLKTIGSSAFRSLGLTSVVIPDTVTTIGSYAFNGNKLTEVILPSGLKKIEMAAFVSNKLTSIDIPSTVTSLSYYSFNINQMTDEYAFIYARKSDGSIDYSNLVSYAGANKHVIIPETKNGVTLTKIDGYAFYGSGLQSVVIPDTVTTIGNLAFNNNQLPQNQAYIYKRTSSGIDYSTLISYGGADRGANNVVVVPQTVNGVDLKIIGANAFNQTSMKQILLPDTVERIESGAFSCCYFTQFTIPASLTYFADNSMKKETSWGNFNMITKIINKSGRSFNWGKITASNTTSNAFVTGTLKHQFGDIEIVAG